MTNILNDIYKKYKFDSIVITDKKIRIKVNKKSIEIDNDSISLLSLARSIVGERHNHILKEQFKFSIISYINIKAISYSVRITKDKIELNKIHNESLYDKNVSLSLSSFNRQNGKTKRNHTPITIEENTLLPKTECSVNKPVDKRIKGNILRNKKLKSVIYDIVPDIIPEYIDGNKSNIQTCDKESYTVYYKGENLGRLYKLKYTDKYCFEYILPCKYNDAEPENEWLESIEDFNLRVYRDIYFYAEDEKYEVAIKTALKDGQKYLKDRLKVLNEVLKNAK